MRQKDVFFEGYFVDIFDVACMPVEALQTMFGSDVKTAVVNCRCGSFASAITCLADARCKRRQKKVIKKRQRKRKKKNRCSLSSDRPVATFTPSKDSAFFLAFLFLFAVVYCLWSMSAVLCSTPSKQNYDSAKLLWFKLLTILKRVKQDFIHVRLNGTSKKWRLPIICLICSNKCFGSAQSCQQITSREMQFSVHNLVGLSVFPEVK